jgi:hypothetical protein
VKNLDTLTDIRPEILTQSGVNEMREQITFSTLAELRDWLNSFPAAHLETVYPHSGDYIVLEWLPQRMSDGSEVIDVDISTHQK